MTVEQIISSANLLPGGPDVLRSADKRMAELQDVVGQPSSEDDVLALDWAGIGDACCHTRLILQHLVSKQGKRVTWIATKKVGNLFKDDDYMRVLEGFYNHFRNPGGHGQVVLSQWINTVFEERFPKWKKIHVSNMVMCRYFEHVSAPNISDFFFRCCSMQRDFSIKHSLKHLGFAPEKPPKNPYLVLEYIADTYGKADRTRVTRLVENLSNIGITSVCVGPSDGWVVPRADMRLGMNLYDTFSIVKGAIVFVGRSSGNQSLTCFLPSLPIFEVDVGCRDSYKTCGLHPKTTSIGPEWDSEIPSLVQKIVQKQTGCV
jgi:hypothetical protein